MLRAGTWHLKERMNSKNFYITLFFILTCFRLLIIPIGTNDLAVWISDGLHILNTLSISRVDLYSLHPNLEFIYPARFSNIIFGAIYKLFDFQGVAIFLRLWIFAAIFLIYKGSQKNNFQWNEKNFVILSLSTIGITLFLDRPACFAVLLAIYIFPFFEKSSLKLKEVILLFSLFILWNNLHSSFFIILPIILYKFLISVYKKKEILNSFKIGTIFFLSIWFTPEGENILHYVYQTITTSKNRNILEWSNVFKFAYPQTSILLLLIFLFIIYRFYQLKKIKKLIYSPLFPLLFLGLGNIRNAIWLFLIAPYLLTKYDLWYKSDNKFFVNKKLNLFIIISLSFSIIYISPWIHLNKKNNFGFGTDSPIMATKVILKKTIRQKIFNQWEVGSYLTLKQTNPIYIDTRNIIYNQSIYDEYIKILNCTSTCARFLNKYNFTTVILRKEKWPLINYLKTNWTKAFEDKDFILFFK